MKAIIVREFGDPEMMNLEEVETPQPSGDEVLVRVHAVGVNPVETYIRSGNYAKLPELPYTPGKDAAGVVEGVGENVTLWKNGDRVYTANSVTGAYAEYTICREADLGRLPESVSFEAGAGIWTPYATSYRALFQKGNAKAGETVLVHGASGGVGIAAVQWAKHARLVVIGTASSVEGRELVAAQGADFVFDHSEDGYLQAIMDATDGAGVDLVVEMLANVNLEKDLSLIKMFGRVSVVGNRGSLEFNPRAMMAKDATVTAMSLYNAPRDAFLEVHAAIYDGLTDGYLNPVFNRTFPLADAPKAHEMVITQKAGGKILLIP